MIPRLQLLVTVHGVLRRGQRAASLLARALDEMHQSEAPMANRLLILGPEHRANGNLGVVQFAAADESNVCTDFKLMIMCQNVEQM